MIIKVKPKQSITANAVPETLERGELAINVTDRKLYSSDGNTVFELTGGSSNNNSNPNGPNTSIQFNDSGTLNGNESFTYNKTTNTISIGNSSVNATINSTFFSKTANNALTANVANTSLFANYSYFANVANTVSNITNTQIISALGYIPADSANGLGFVPVNKAGDSMTGQLNVGSNVQLTLSSLIIGNSTVNTTVNSTMFRIGTANVWTTASLTNVSQLANNAGYITNVNTSLGYSPANKAGDTFTGTVNVGTNVNISTSGLSIGNTTVNTTVNSTMFRIGAANVWTTATLTNLNQLTNGPGYITNVNTSLGYVPANTTSPIFSDSVTIGNSTINVTANSTAIDIGANVDINTSGISIGNSTVNTTVNSTMFRIGTANVWTTASLVNVSQLSNNAGYITNVNTSLGYIPANRAGDTFTNTVNVGANVIISLSGLSIGNSTVNTTVNSSMFRIGTANVWTTASLINISQLSNDSGYITNVNTSLGYIPANTTTPTFSGPVTIGNSTVNVIANSTTLTIGTQVVNTSGFYAGSNVVLNTTRLFIGNSTVNVTANSTAIDVGANVDINTSGFLVGNSTVNTTVNSTMFAINGSNVWTQTTLTNLNQLTNGPGYITNVNTSLGYTPANRAGDTFTGTVNIGANVVLTTSSMTIGNSTVNSTQNSTMFAINGSNVWTQTTLTNLNQLTNGPGYITNVNTSLGYIPANTTTPIFSGPITVGNSTINVVANSTTLTIGTQVVNTSGFYSGANVVLTTSSMTIGNSTVNTTQNSTMFAINGSNVWTQTTLTNLNQLTNGPGYITNVNTSLGYTPANRAGDTFTGTVNIGSNVRISTVSIAIGNSTANITANSSIISIGNTGNLTATALNIGANTLLNTTRLFVGNSTVNVSVNSSVIVLNSQTINATGHYIGSNVALTTGILSIGNSTVNTVVNATGISILGTGGSLGVGTTQSGTTGEIRATGNIAGYFSDMRLKKDIVVIPEAIEKVKNISGVYYRTNDIAKSYGYQDDQTLQVGVLAQEIQKQFPQLVQIAPFDSDFSDGTLKSKSGENYLTVNMLGLIPVLIESIKELSDKVDNLENELNKYKNNTN